MKYVYGVEMKTPMAEKTPGYYAQVIKRIANQIQVIDHDQSLFILPTPEDRDKLITIFSKRNILEESYELIQLPQGETTPLFPDYGFISNRGLLYLYAPLIFVFWIEQGEELDQKMALIQLEEVIICKENKGGKDNQTLLAADYHQKPLIEKIAAAYNITIRTVKHIKMLDKLSE